MFIAMTTTSETCRGEVSEAALLDCHSRFAGLTMTTQFYRGSHETETACGQAGRNHLYLRLPRARCGRATPGWSASAALRSIRTVPAEEPYRFGDPERPVMAHVRFREGGAPIDVPLRSPGGIVPCPHVNLTGQGSMLSAQVVVPEDAACITIWFSYTTASGVIRDDSDYGANYRFGFPCREIDVVRATVTRQPEGPGDRFDLIVRTTQAVEDATAQFSLVGDTACIKHEVRLQRVSEVAAKERGLLWAAAIDLPHGATTRFKVCYWIGGRRLVDDNTGAFYSRSSPNLTTSPRRLRPCSKRRQHGAEHRSRRLKGTRCSRLPRWRHYRLPNLTWGDRAQLSPIRQPSPVGDAAPAVRTPCPSGCRTG